jgi:hypothetical protein
MAGCFKTWTVHDVGLRRAERQMDRQMDRAALNEGLAQMPIKSLCLTGKMKAAGHGHIKVPNVLGD